jgi:phage terminase small subunit
MKRTEKQKRFAEEYVKTGNGTQSYINAGYSASTRKVAESNARKLLANYTQITSYIKELNNNLMDSQIADMEEVKRFWTVTFRDGDMDPKHRLKASEYIAKTNAAFIDNINANVTGNKKLEDFFK